MLVHIIRKSKFHGLLTLAAAAMAMTPTAGIADGDQDQTQSTMIHAGRNLRVTGSAATGSAPASNSTPFTLFGWQPGGNAGAAKQANAPVPVFNDQAPVAAPKFQSRVQANQILPTPNLDPQAAPPTPVKFKSLVGAGPAPTQAPPASGKFTSRVQASSVAPAPAPEGSVDQAPVVAPAPPTSGKFASRVQASSVAPAPAPAPQAVLDPSPVVAPAPPTSGKFASRVQAAAITPAPDAAPQGVVDPSPVVAPAPPTSGKFASRVQAAAVAPAPDSAPEAVVDQPQVVAPAPPTSAKFASRVQAAAIAPAPAVAPKMQSRVAADQVQTVAPDATAPTAPLSQAVGPVTATGPCPTPLAINGVTQATDLSKTLNQTLAQVNPKQVVASTDDPLNWEDDDAIDSKQMAKLGTKETAPRTDAKAVGALTPFVRKLSAAAHNEVNRRCRVIDGHNICKAGSKRACLQGVRMAFEAADPHPLKGGWTKKAKDAGPFLKKYGYSKSPAGAFTPKTAPVGSVLIYDVPGHPSQAGHIEIKLTDGYYSDFYEKDPITAKLGGLRRLIGIWVPPTT